MTVRRLSLATLALLLGAMSCTADPTDGSDLDTTFSAQMASTWHYVGTPQRVQIGVLANDADGIRVVTQGTIDVAFAPLGDGGASGPPLTANFVPVPGTDASGDTPTIASGANGVYEVIGVTFDTAGVWSATISLEVDGVARELNTDFEVLQDSPIPAPGMPAPATKTLTIGSKGVTDGAIDSMADVGGKIPDPELHEISIADAIARGTPALVLFGTPLHCTSRFCGPEVTELQRFAAEYSDRAAYIHVEIWKEYQPERQVVNKGAADWLLWKRSDGTPEMTEPWLYLIDAEGIVAERWGPLFDISEVEAALEALPPMDA
jgi:hypothetical protein